MPAKELLGRVVAMIDPYEIIKEYELSLTKNEKMKGAHYTHPNMARKVVENSLITLQGKNLNSLKICDPSCGGGIFLLEIVKYLSEDFNLLDPRIGCCVSTPLGDGHIHDVDPDGIHVEIHLDNACSMDYEWMSGWDVAIKRKNFSDTAEKSNCSCLNVKNETLQYIARNCIFGFDIDENAVLTTKKALSALTGLNKNEFDHNILCGDFLFDDRVSLCDGFVGNPPFLGGGKISGVFGADYLKRLKHDFEPANGPVDYCAYFFRRASYLLKDDGVIGFIATNTISQGATRIAGLAQLIEEGMIIYRADTNWKWPGTANVTCSTVYLTNNWLHVHMRKSQ